MGTPGACADISDGHSENPPVCLPTQRSGPCCSNPKPHRRHYQAKRLQVGFPRLQRPNAVSIQPEETSMSNRLVLNENELAERWGMSPDRKSIRLNSSHQKI